jgi:hypothetical protein
MKLNGFDKYFGTVGVMKPLDGGLPALEGSPILEKRDG